MNAVKSVHIICDGNRTYSILKGHIKDIDPYAYDIAWRKLEYLTRYLINNKQIRFLIFTVTIRNNYLDRFRSETVRPVSRLLVNHYKRMRNFYSTKNVMVKFVGDIPLFIETSENPNLTKETINLIENMTKDNTDNYVALQVAYDHPYEYLKAFKMTHNLKDENLSTFYSLKKKAIAKYYGRDVPDIDLSIRTMRPRLSNSIPVLIGDYADFYFFPAPFPMLGKRQIDLILDDEKLRIDSKGGKYVYTDNDIKSLRKLSLKDFSNSPIFLGEKNSHLWLPISKKP